MSDILKGNFEPKTKIKAPEKEDGNDLEKRFEKEAMKHLGGSIAFVAKKKILWPDEEN